MNFDFAHFCPQLFYLPKNSAGLPEPLASAVLVNIGDHFLVTAKHVFEKKSINEVFIFIGPGKIVRLYGDLGFYLPVGERDTLDIAMLRLPEDLVKNLSQRYSFLHHKNIDFTSKHQTASEFMLYGFVANQTELKNRIFESNQFGMLTKSRKIPANHPSGFSNKENIWLSYNRRKQSFIDSSSRNIGPKDLRGLSGGGVWAVFDHEIHPHRRYYMLVGIMIEQRIDRGYIISSGTQMLVGILHHRFGISPNAYLILND